MTGPTSRTSERRRDARGGFTLLELSLALAIFGLIAALALPRMMPVQSTTDLKMRAWQVAALLRADRNAALRNGRQVLTAVDAGSNAVRSGATGGILRLPDGVALRLDGGFAGAVRFGPDGRSSGGTVFLTRGDAGYGVRVHPATGTVDLAEVRR
jgi:general secretion pathway protein H